MSALQFNIDYVTCAIPADHSGTASKMGAAFLQAFWVCRLKPIFHSLSVRSHTAN